MSTLTRAKIAQAQHLVQECGFGCWMLFVRETSESPDPTLALVMEGGLTWQSALIITASKAVAVVGNYDADPLRASGDWDEVVPYVEDAGPVILAALERTVPAGASIAVNYSVNDVKADGLTHGMWLLLHDMLAGSGRSAHLVSAEPLAMRLRGQKLPEEIALIKRAIEEGDRLFDEIAQMIPKRPTEREVYLRVHDRMRERGLGFGWDPHGDPIVNSGPDSMIGHGIPSDSIRVEPGHVFHVDLGVIFGGYSSDIQRCWYAAGPKEKSVPEDVVKAAEAVNSAITAGAERLRPGVQGWEVDAAAREAIKAAGWPEYKHALGHQVGRAAHDGGAILGPKWARYGNTPNVPVREGEVYTIELGVTLPDRGYLGLEEMVVVTAQGCEFLSKRQMEIPLVRLAKLPGTDQGPAPRT